MRSLALMLVAIAGLLAAAPQAAAQAPAPVPEGCVADPPPCVYVTPDPAQGLVPGAVFVFHGRGWRPGKLVEAVYGSYCPATVRYCAGVGRSTRFRAEGAGRFTFHFRNGENPTRAMPEPRGAGGEAASMTFETVLVQRDEERLRIDAIPPPGPSTPEDRLAAQAVAKAVEHARRALLSRDDAVAASLRSYERQLLVCRRDLGRFREGTRRAQIVAALIGLAFDRAAMAPIRAQLRAFVADLQQIAPHEPVVLAGVQAWATEVRRPRAWPRPSLCGALKRWRATGFALNRAPADPRTAAVQELRSAVRSNAAILAAATRLRALGAGRATEELFGGELVELAALLGDHI